MIVYLPEFLKNVHFRFPWLTEGYIPCRVQPGLWVLRSAYHIDAASSRRVLVHLRSIMIDIYQISALGLYQDNKLTILCQAHLKLPLQFSYPLHIFVGIFLGGHLAMVATQL